MLRFTAGRQVLDPPFALLPLLLTSTNSPSLPLHAQIGTWYSNNTLVMNATSLDLNASETLANKTLVVTTILVVWHKWK